MSESSTDAEGSCGGGVDASGSAAPLISQFGCPSSGSTLEQTPDELFAKLETAEKVNEDVGGGVGDDDEVGSVDEITECQVAHFSSLQQIHEGGKEMGEEELDDERDEHEIRPPRLSPRTTLLREFGPIVSQTESEGFTLGSLDAASAAAVLSRRSALQLVLSQEHPADDERDASGEDEEEEEWSHGVESETSADFVAPEEVVVAHERGTAWR